MGGAAPSDYLHNYIGTYLTQVQIGLLVLIAFFAGVAFTIYAIKQWK